MLEKFERREIDPDEWRAFRLVRGTYGQRQDGDVHMLRLKVPQGVLDARQLYESPSPGGCALGHCLTETA